MTICFNCLTLSFRWDFIKCLHQLQTDEGLRAGNQLKKSHINWKQQRMKVNLAAQVLSRSVADAISFCREDLQLPQFKGSEATVGFLKQFDLLFDLMNSKNLLGKGFKSPLKKSNEFVWKATFLSAFDYISGLKTSSGTKLINSPRRAGFLGFLCNIKSFQNIFDKCVTNGPLDFLLTFKFSQDHIELLFCSLRTRFGSNNNPSAKEFQHAYKRLLLHQEITGKHGNCIIDNDAFLLPVNLPPLKNQSELKPFPDFKNYNWLLPFESDHDYSVLSHWPNLSEFQSAVIEYIAGFCVKMAIKSITCPQCLKAVIQQGTEKNFKLVNRKDRGGLIHVNASVRVVCEETEKIVKKLFLLSNGMVPSMSDTKQVVTSCVLQNVVSRYE